MSENPYQTPVEAGKAKEPTPTNTITPSAATYNVVTDMVGGLNLRRSDNAFQALFILVSIVLAALVGAILAFFNPNWNLPWMGGAVFGAVAGLVFGTFASGIFLMIYRAMRHLKGKHD